MNDYTPEEWAQILQAAKQRLLANPGDERAREAMKAANQFLGQQREAVSEQERQEAQPGALTALGLGFSDAATVGFGDEVAGLADAIGAIVPGGQSPAQAYVRARDVNRDLTKGSAAAHPLASLGGQALGIAGTIAAPAGKGVSLGRNALRSKHILARALGALGGSAVTGAAYGAASGLGHGEGSVSEQLRQTGEGAATGAVLAPLALGGGALALGAAKKFLGPSVKLLAGATDDAQRVRPRRAPRPRARQMPVEGEVRAGFPPKPPADPLDVPTFARRAAKGGESPSDVAVMRRALERPKPKPNTYSTRQMPGGKPKRSARNRQATTAQQQLESLSLEELEQAKGLASGDRRILNMIEQEIAKRAKP